MEKMVGFDNKLDLVVLNKLLAQLDKKIDDNTGGASGTFTTADIPAKTVTVVNGLITSIV